MPRRAAGARSGTMAAHQHRPPPNNLLFCGPPPSLPQVVLLPSASAGAAATPQDVQTNDDDTLQEINNVGVPTYGEKIDGQLENNELKIDSSEYNMPSENYLRRTQSFDISDIFTTRFDNNLDASSLRHRNSEPDLSKYGLFVEAEVSVDCAPVDQQQPQLVLNNPFYNGSYAMTPAVLNQAMVMLPENYLAFEDAFVPTWEYKPEFVERDYATGLYYEGLPLIPANDPWSAYCNDNGGFEYYSPHYETSLGEHDGVHYMPLTDLDYAIPTYMSLPVVEQANVEIVDNVNLTQNETEVSTDNQTCDINDPGTNVVSDCDVSLNNEANEDVKVDATETDDNKESSPQSEESLNADISNDITSSLAFIPSSKSSQVPGGANDTSDDTSPCSTDYQEASALDLVQSLDEISCCDSTDYSQSRDELSPIPADCPTPPQTNVPLVVENKKPSQIEVHKPNSKTISNLPLSQLPSIPIPEHIPQSVSPRLETNSSNELPKEVFRSEVIIQSNVCNDIKAQENQKPPSVPLNNSECSVKSDTVPIKELQPMPHPPAVPPSWLPKLPSDKPKGVPVITVQNVETIQKVGSQPPIKVNHIAVESQPSCSFVPPHLPMPSSQLKPDKQPNEVEVRSLVLDLTL